MRLSPATHEMMARGCFRPAALIRHHRGAVALSNLPLDTTEDDLRQLARGLPLVGASFYDAAMGGKAGPAAAGRAAAGEEGAEGGAAAGPGSRLAFLLFDDLAEAQQAVRRLHLAVVGGRQVRAMAVR